LHFTRSVLYGKTHIVGTIAEDKESEYLAYSTGKNLIRVIGTDENGEEHDIFGGGYDGYDVHYNTGFGLMLPHIIVQFMETDWELAARLASRHHTCIIPECRSGLTRYYFGPPDLGKLEPWKPSVYTARQTRRNDTLSRSCPVRDREMHEIGENVLIHDHYLQMGLGAEIGIYRSPVGGDEGIYQSASGVKGEDGNVDPGSLEIKRDGLGDLLIGDRYMLDMTYALYEPGRNQPSFVRSGKHWWLNGFRPGDQVPANEIKVVGRITFTDIDMKRAFVRRLNDVIIDKGYLIKIVTDESDLSVNFDWYGGKTSETDL
jgi:hypothetical protein